MAFKKFYVSTPDVANEAQLQRVFNTFQQNVEDEFSAVNRISILDNRIISNVVVSTSTAVEHKLGRTPLGYIVINRNANAQIWNGTIDDKFLNLNSSGAVTVSLLVF